MAYSNFSLDAFRAALVNGGARNNLFLVSGSFPGGGAGALNAAAGAAGAVFGGAVAGAVSNMGAAIGGGDPAGQMQFLCKASSIPASTLTEGTATFMGRTFKFAGDRTFATWNLTCYNDGSYGLRKAFEKWSNVINSYAGNLGPNNQNSYLTDWNVSPLTREGNPICTYKFVGCFPTELGAVTLDTQGDSNISTFTVNLSYQYHELQGVTT